MTNHVQVLPEPPTAIRALVGEKQAAARAARARRLGILVVCLLNAGLVAVEGAVRLPAISPRARREALARDVARFHGDRGVAAYQGERYDEALAHFEMAQRLRPQAALQWNIAQAARRLDRLEAAREGYRRFLAARETDEATVAMQGAAVSLLAEVEQELARRAAPPAPEPQRAPARRRARHR